MARFRCISLGLRQRDGGHQSELPVQVIQNPDRHIVVPVEKAAILAQNAQLEGETAAVIVTAAAQHFRAIGFRQRPLAGEFLFAGIFG